MPNPNQKHPHTLQWPDGMKPGRVSRPVKALVIVVLIAGMVVVYLWWNRPTPTVVTPPEVAPTTPGTSTPTQSELEAFMNQLPDGPDLPEAELRAELETFMDRIDPATTTSDATNDPVSEAVRRTELVAFLERISPE